MGKSETILTDNTRSKCCNAKVKVVGKTTLYHICLKCKKACDVYFTIRKTWTRNPATQVQKDKREKMRKKELDKDIQQIGNA